MLCSLHLFTFIKLFVKIFAMGGLVTWKALAGLLFLTVNVQSQDFYENFEESLLNEGNRSFFC